MTPPLPDPDALALPDAIPLPRATALALWTGAYLRGDCGPDDAVAAARGTGHRRRPRELVEEQGEDLFDWMVGVRRLPLVQLRAVLPEPGRIAGLVGPPTAITAALEAGQAVVVTAAGLAEHTLVPSVLAPGAGSEGTVIGWQRIPGRGDALAPAPGASGARTAFLRALQGAAASAAHLDIVPDEPVSLAHLPANWTAVAAPPHLPADRLHLLLLAARTLLLTDQELAGDAERPGVVGLAQSTARTSVLRELREAAREAVVDVVTDAASA